MTPLAFFENNACITPVTRYSVTTMAFVKLDTSILNSTVWMETIQRNMFITALLMAEPFEATAPMEQIEVRSLQRTGFAAPPGWYGFVHAAGVGIARQAGIEADMALDALEIMGKEEPESRSPEYGGRRLIRVDGGYLVLNFQKYRDKDHTAKERVRRWRERKKAGAPVTRNGNGETRNVTQAEAQAEALTPLSPPERGAVGELEQRLADVNSMRARMMPRALPPLALDELMTLEHEASNNGARSGAQGPPSGRRRRS